MINKIKSKRALLDLNQTELGKKIGVGRQAIQNYERGINVPSVIISLKMAQLFNCPVDEIFELEESEMINQEINN